MSWIDEITELSFDDKIKVWIDYIVTISYLNNDKPLISDRHFNENLKFPILGCYFGTSHNIKPVCFDDFVSPEKCIVKTDYGNKNGATGIQINYLGIYDWYPKFKNRIFKIN